MYVSRFFCFLKYFSLYIDYIKFVEFFFEVKIIFRFLFHWKSGKFKFLRYVKLKTLYFKMDLDIVSTILLFEVERWFF